MANLGLGPPPAPGSPRFIDWVTLLYKKLSGTFTADTVTTNANLTGPITSVGNATAIASQTGTGSKFVVDTSPTLVTPNIGAATGTSLKVSTALGFKTGAGGTDLQNTSKSNSVEVDKPCGSITMNSAALAAGAKVSFVVNNSTVAADDVPVVAVASGGTANAYRASCTAVTSGSFSITVENITAGSLSEFPVINFVVIKSVTS